MSESFEQHFRGRVAEVHARPLWQQVSKPPFRRIDWGKARPAKNEVALAPWLEVRGPVGASDGPASHAVSDLVACLDYCFDLAALPEPSSARPAVAFRLSEEDRDRDALPAEAGFVLDARDEGIEITSGSQVGLLRGSLYLSNLWRLRGAPFTPRGRRAIRPRFGLRISADLPGGFCTTPAWIPGREEDTNWLELVRYGVNAIPVMAHLEDYLLDEDAPGPFRMLAKPEAAEENRARLAKLCEQAGKFGVQIFLMGYNPKLRLDHPIFDTARGGRPSARGAAQWNNTFRVLCWEDPPTAEFLAGAWAGICRAVSKLGGLMAIVGGEGFYHCHMRAGPSPDCPRCNGGDSYAAVAKLLNHTGRLMRDASPNARLITWPYSAAELWSGEFDQRSLIAKLDPELVWFETEIDKDQLVEKPAGWWKWIWDYSLDDVPPPEKARSQRKHCRRRGVPFGVKTETNVGWETTGLPYVPNFARQVKLWDDVLTLKPTFVHSQWLSGGSTWGTPAEEVGFWAAWGQGELAKPQAAMAAILRREYGGASAVVRRAGEVFSRAITHHPGLQYYRGANFIGTASPLPLDASDVSELDRVFFGIYYWMCETEVHEGAKSLVEPQPLFFVNPAYSAVIKEGPDAGKDVAVAEFRTLMKEWSRGVALLRQGAGGVAKPHKDAFRRLIDLSEHLALTWTSAGNVEEWLRLRNAVTSESHSPTLRYGFREVNRRRLARMEALMRDEVRVAQRDLPLVKRNAEWDTSWHLDMATAPLAEITAAKIEQVRGLLRGEAWKKFKAARFRW